MNRKILPYVNYLLDNEPSPFCDYILCMELLKLDDKTIRESYEWAKQFKLYTEMADEQFPDGSWGDFYPMDTSAHVRKKIKITNRSTIRRLHDLSLDMNDEMVSKTLELCRKIIKGEAPPTRDTIHTKQAFSVLYSFCPDDPLVAHVKAERTLSDEKERAYMIYKWDHGPFDICRLSDLIMPEDDRFVFWMCGLEDASHHKYFSAFMASETTPFLYALCDKLANPHDAITVKTNRYYAKVGQYSEDWNNDIKKKDVLLRIIRLLNKCE